MKSFSPAHLVGFLATQGLHPGGTEAARLLIPQVADLRTGRRDKDRRASGNPPYTTGKIGKSWEKLENHGKIMQKKWETHGKNWKLMEKIGKSWKKWEKIGKSWKKLENHAKSPIHGGLVRREHYRTKWGIVQLCLTIAGWLQTYRGQPQSINAFGKWIFFEA